MAWQAVSPTRWERPLDLIEKLFARVASLALPLGREHWSVSTFVRIKWTSSEDFESALRNAWKTMRYDYPQIACFLEGEKKVYEIPSAKDVEEWLNSTCIIESSSTTAEDLFANFKPSPQAMLHYIPQDETLMLHASHWRIDGIGLLHVFDGLLEAIVNPRDVSFGDEASRLSPSLEEAALVNERCTPAAEQAARDAMSGYLASQPSAGLSPLDTTDPPRGTRFWVSRYSSNETTSIIESCKARGITPTVAVHAAMAIATHDMAKVPTDNYSIIFSVNLRPYLDPPYNSPSHAVALYISGLPVALPPANFKVHTEKLNEVYRRSLDPKNDPYLSGLKEWTQSVLNLFATAPPEGSPEPTEPSLMSLGLVNKCLKQSYGDSLVVTDFWLGIEIISKQLLCHVWTFQGQLHLSACYNESYYTPKFVDRYLQKVKDVLLESLRSSV